MEIFVPPFDLRPVVLEQRLSRDPANDEVISTLVYDPSMGRLGCVLQIGSDESGDRTEEQVLVREEVSVPTQLSAGPIQRLPVEAEFEFELVEPKALRAEDDSGFLGVGWLSVSWEARPYIFTLGGGQAGARQYGNVLAQGGEAWERDFAVGDVRPDPVERRKFELKDVKGPVALGVGIEHKLHGLINEYKYTYKLTSNWKLTKITTE